MAVGLDNYQRGNPAEQSFLNGVWQGAKSAGAPKQYPGRFYLASAGGKFLGTGPQELEKVIEEWKSLPESERKPEIEKATASSATDRTAPEAPPGTLVLATWYRYLERDGDGGLARTKKIHDVPHLNEWRKDGIAVNVPPNREPFWITAEESKSFVPRGVREGTRFPLPEILVKRIAAFYVGDKGINAEHVSNRAFEGRLDLVVEKVTTQAVHLRLEGRLQSGATYEESHARYKEARSTRDMSKWQRSWPAGGCEMKFLGYLEYDTQKEAFQRFDVMALGATWGGETVYFRGQGGQVWPGRSPMGIFFELALGDSPAARAVPYCAKRYWTGSLSPELRACVPWVK